MTQSSLLCQFEHSKYIVDGHSVECQHFHALSAANTYGELTDEELELSIWTRPDEENGSLNPKFTILSSSSMCCA